MRFAAIYQGKWSFAIQDPRMLEIVKFEWWETLKNFDRNIIMETVADVKKIADDFPSIQKFYEIAAAKAKVRKANAEMEERKRRAAEEKLLEHKYDPALAAEAREKIRRLCNLKSVNPNGAGLRPDDGKRNEGDYRDEI